MELHGNWIAQNKIRLEKLITEKAFSDNYAVFDWDFTCIFFDVQDSLFLYQIEQLCFNLTPERFAHTIRAGVPQNIPLKHCYNNDGKPLTAALLSEDVDARYRFLYNLYQGLGGSQPLAKVLKTNEFYDFKAKLIILSFAAVTVCTTDISQSLSTGMRLAELERLVETAIDAALTEDIKEYTISSPPELAGSAGTVTASYRKGIRLQPEIQELFQCLQNNGIEPYICSASQEDTVRVFACNPKYGYNLPQQNIFGRRRKTDATGVFTDAQDTTIPQTWKEGKREAIKTLIAPRYGGKAPILIAGDSDGDFYMMEAFKDEALLLIFDRNPLPQEKIYSFVQKGLAVRQNPNASIIVQPRNETTGLFIRGR